MLCFSDIDWSFLLLQGIMTCLSVASEIVFTFLVILAFLRLQHIDRFAVPLYFGDQFRQTHLSENNTIYIISNILQYLCLPVNKIK